MRKVVRDGYDVAGAREEIFTLIRRNPTNNLVIYFDGWGGLGAATVLRSIAQVVPCMEAPPPELCFGTTIYVDCSRWTSMRAMQKKVAQKLGLDRETLSMFEEQDEEDDFSGVDLSSRDVIRSAAVVIDRTLRKSSRFLMVFINGSHDEIVLGRLGIPENISDCIILWTFSTTTGLSRGLRVAEKIRFTDVLLYFADDASYLPGPQFIALLREEAASIVAHHPACMSSVMDLTTVEDCFIYELLLHHSFGRSTSGFVWPAHAPNFWVCDGTIIQGDRAWEVSSALHPDVSLGCHAHVLDVVLKKLKRQCNETAIPLLLVEDRHYYVFGGEGPCYRWISVKLSHEQVSEELQATFAKASSIFLSFKTEDGAGRLSNGLFKQCNNLGVLVLSRCAFSFISPPFLHCHKLRFLGLDHCMDDKKNNAVELEGESCAAIWAFLKSLWVIDLYYTDWVEILSEDKVELMANLMELNIEGVRWPRWTSHQIQKKLPYLQHLRIIKPVYNEVAETTSSDIGDSFPLANTRLEILDLSGSNRITGRNLTTSISKASHLQMLILDGCDGLGDVVLSDNSSLRSFSFDGYGPVLSSHRTSTVELPPKISRPKHPSTDVYNKKEGTASIKTSTVSLEGCTWLEKLFLRGLPNLVELNLSGCAIKVLDFTAMVMDVPKLKRLFLLGCEHLRAIKWGSAEQQLKQLELICIDTRPRSKRVALECGSSSPSFISAQQKSIQLQMHAILPDARFARSLYALVEWVAPHCYFNIRVTSSDACSTGAVVQPTAMTRSMMYGDVFTKVGDGPAPMQVFPQAPTGQSNCHIEIGDGNRNVQSEVEEGWADNLVNLMRVYTQSVHVHDVSTCSGTMPAGQWLRLRWCRVERCPNLHFVFPPDLVDYWGKLETIWASDLLMARCVWSKGRAGSDPDHLKILQHLHLRRCPSLQFALAMGREPSLPSLETLHIIHCGDLRHVFVPGNEKNQHTSIEFPKLTSIHLHDLPALQQICEAAEMVAPALETIVVRGCWSLCRLPALKGREPGMRKPAVEIEKDVWDALEWDGVDAGHHPSLYEAPVHSRYYKRRFIRRTVLR